MDLEKLRQFMTQGEKNLLLLENLIASDEKFYVWCYDRDGTYIASSCALREREVLDQAFRALGGLEALIQYGKDTGNTNPQILGSSIGMQWALSYESERNRELIFVLGPVFFSTPLEWHLRAGLSPYMDRRENARWASALIQLLPELPVMSYAVFTRYVMMVHNTLTGQQLGLESLGHSVSGEPAPQASTVGQRDRNQVYLFERAMLQMVRNGDINYHKAIQNSSALSTGVPVHGKDPLRQAKTSIVVYTSLVARAAIEGGLSPEIAYPLGDSYIQAAEDCRDSGKLMSLAAAMYHDFIYRVHHLRTNPNYSHTIQKCCDYIELSLDRKIRAADLAALVGYSEYYLTEKFKRETGHSVNSYIRFAKIERAKLLLETSTLSVKELSERLSFGTVNYFIQSFQSVAGCTPAQYRKNKEKSLFSANTPRSENE